MTTFAQMSQQRNYIRRRIGITSAPWPCLVREWPHDSDVTFGVVMLIDDDVTPDLLVDRWLIRGVDEAQARAVLAEAMK